MHSIHGEKNKCADDEYLLPSTKDISAFVFDGRWQVSTLP